MLVVRTLRLGGMERMTINLANALQQAGHNVHILVFKNRIELSPNAGIEVHVADLDRWFKYSGIGLLYDFFTRGIIGRIHRRSRIIFRAFYFSALFKLWLKRLEWHIGQRVDLIIARGQGSFEGLTFFDDPRLLRVIVNELWLKKITWADRLFYPHSYHNHHVLFNSAGVLQQFHDICQRLGVTPASTSLIRNPTDLTRIREQANEALDNEQTTPFILNVGRLEHAKNQILLLRAFAHIAAQIPHRLIIVGEGSLRDSLLAEAENLKVADRVDLVGAKSNPYPWMRQADLFVLSSLHEGLPNVVIESLVCGTPVVITEGKGGSAELMQGELKNFIAKAEPAALGEMILKALQQPPAIDPQFVESFSMNRVAEQFTDFCERVKP